MGQIVATLWDRFWLEYGKDYGYTMGQIMVRVLEYGTDYDYTMEQIMIRVLEYGTDYCYTMGEIMVKVWDRLWLHYGTDYG